eukprot:m.431850 g.431850  ORF g.431850 m.431850 type:complete len:57 (+) comp17358_c0_seq1:1210-1380(+)
MRPPSTFSSAWAKVTGTCRRKAIVSAVVLVCTGQVACTARSEIETRGTGVWLRSAM